MGDGVTLTDEQRLDWLRLIRSDNIGPRTFRELVNHFGGARAALDALPDLARRGGAARPGAHLPARGRRARTRRRRARSASHFVALGEPDYPPRLQMIDDAPPLIAVRGKPRGAGRGRWSPSSARATPPPPAPKFAERLARELGEAGFGIVSGLARGIDAAAHRASLASGTVAVLAGGHRPHLPGRTRRACSTRSCRKAPRCREMPLGWEPRARDFPRRNRLISGLSLGVVIVEAARRSGSLITARIAGEQGREVFAVPGSPLDPRAEGTNGLLKQGATLVTEAADVIAVLEPILGRSDRTAGRASPSRARRPKPSPATTSAPASSACSGPRRSRSTIWCGCRKRSPAIVRTVLLELEIAGRLERHGGALVSLL